MSTDAKWSRGPNFEAGIGDASGRTNEFVRPSIEWAATGHAVLDGTQGGEYRVGPTCRIHSDRGNSLARSVTRFARRAGPAVLLQTLVAPSLSKGLFMGALLIVAIVVVVVVLLGAAMSLKIVQQYEQGVLFRLGRVVGEDAPGLHWIIPFIDVLRRVSLRIVTMPIQSQGIITRDNVSVDVSAVAYFRVVDATKSVIAIENVFSAIDQIAQTTLRKVVGQHTLDETLAETDRINVNIREILDVQTEPWGVVVTLVELKDIQLPESMKRAMARQAEAEREKRAKIIAAEGESLAAAALGEASDTMMAHPLALQLRNLQSLVEIGVDKNTTVVFPAPIMSTIQELGAFLARETAASGAVTGRNSTVTANSPANGAAATAAP